MTAKFTIAELCECAKREVKQRKHVYARLVYQGKMDQKEAEREIALMRAIAEYFDAKTNPKFDL